MFAKYAKGILRGQMRRTAGWNLKKMSFQVLHTEIEFAMQDITAELTSLNEHLNACNSRLIRFRNPGKSHYEVIKEQCELPFTNGT